MIKGFMDSSVPGFQVKPKNKKPDFHYLDLRLFVFLLHPFPLLKDAP
jgi:hypothetical protein